MIGRRLIAVSKNSTRIITRSMGGGHHGPNMPPFARLRPPTKSVNQFTIKSNQPPMNF